MAHRAIIARQDVDPLPAKDASPVTREDVRRMIAEAAIGGGAAVVFKAGPGIKIESAVNAADVLEYTISLDLALESADRNIEIKEQNP